jgi:hypothetical protein
MSLTTSVSLRFITQVAAEDDDLVLGAEGGGEQPAGVEPLEPLAVVHVALGAALQADGLAGIDDADGESAGLQQLEQGDPVNAGRFQRHTGDPAGLEPIGQGDQVGRVRAEAPDRLGIGTRGHGDPVLGGADVDGCRVGVDDGQVLRSPGFGDAVGLAYAHGGLRSQEMRIGATGSGRDGAE